MNSNGGTSSPRFLLPFVRKVIGAINIRFERTEAVCICEFPHVGGLTVMRGAFVMQALLGDVVWRTTRDPTLVVVVLLLPEATLDYGLLSTKVGRDTPLIVFSLAMVWPLVRLVFLNNQRWWLLAGLFDGLALLSKYTVILLVPGIIAFALAPRWRMA
jgi:4-amino-4-deoxy-L-arabinose transferase-like glycosyltransferase